MGFETEPERIWGRALAVVIQREKDEPDFLTYEEFEKEEKPNRARAERAYQEVEKIAQPEIENYFTLAFATDQQDRKLVPADEEIAEASAGLSVSQIESASDAWWHA